MRKTFSSLIFVIALLTAGRGAAQPAIYWASDPVEPGDTVLVAGNRLDGAVVTLSRLDAAADAPTRRLGVLQASRSSLKFQIPQDFPAGVYRFRIDADSGDVEGYLNAPTVYWAQGDLGKAASPAGWLRIMGRNIARAPAAALTLVNEKTHATFDIGASDAGLWDARFVIGPDIAPGAYDLKLWNGVGPRALAASAGRMEIQAKPAFPPHRIDVRQRGARGDGRSDDTAAFRRALSQLADLGGGALAVPRGVYLLSGALDIPENVDIVGEGPALSILVVANSESPPPVILKGARAFRIEQLAIYASNHGHIVQGGLDANGDVIEDANVSISNILIRTNIFRSHLKREQEQARFETAMRNFPPRGPDALHLAGGNLRVENSDIQGSVNALMLMSAHHAFVAGNRFEHGREGWYSITNPDGVIFENNVVVGGDQLAGGGGINTLWGPARAIAQNVLIKNNRFSDFPGGDGEAMTTDAPGGCYHGAVAGVRGGLQVELPGLSAADAAALEHCRLAGGIVIVEGEGVGASARIGAVENGKLKLIDPLPTDLDASSVGEIVPVQRRVLAIGNRADDAGVAIQFYGSNWEQVAADNTTERSGGFVVWGRDYHGLQPSLFVQFLNNRLRTGEMTRQYPNPAQNSRIAVLGSSAERVEKQTLTRGVIVRGNQLLGNAEIFVDGRDRDHPGVVDVIVENNAIQDVDTGIVVGAGVRGLIVKGNTTANVRVPLSNASPGP